MVSALNMRAPWVLCGARPATTAGQQNAATAATCTSSAAAQHCPILAQPTRLQPGAIRRTVKFWLKVAETWDTISFKRGSHSPCNGYGWQEYAMSVAGISRW